VRDSSDGGSVGVGEEKREGEKREGGVDSFAGSFGYAAPEVLAGLRHGLKVDCWSIGYVRPVGLPRPIAQYPTR
jgi:hypothetical protein